jgi:hypothetical protein
MNIDNSIKFRHLLCFLEVARQGSLARAAEVLANSQPAVSKTLKELEEVLATSLFDRSKRGVVPTAAGLAFLRYAGPSVQALREGVRSLRSGEHEAGVVRLGVAGEPAEAAAPDDQHRRRLRGIEQDGGRATALRRRQHRDRRAIPRLGDEPLDRLDGGPRRRCRRRRRNQRRCLQR